MPNVTRKLISGMVALSSGVRVIPFLTASFVPALFKQPYQRVRTRSLLLAVMGLVVKNYFSAHKDSQKWKCQNLKIYWRYNNIVKLYFCKYFKMVLYYLTDLIRYSNWIRQCSNNFERKRPIKDTGWLPNWLTLKWPSFKVKG